MPRPRLGTRAVCLVLATLGISCAAPQGPNLAVPSDAAAVEVRFGDSYCRRLERPEAIEGLLAFAAAHELGWQASWNEPDPPTLVFRFLAEEGSVLTLGLGEGQLRTLFDGRNHFQPLSEAERRDLLERLGGPPSEPPEIPCATAGASRATEPAP